MVAINIILQVSRRKHKTIYHVVDAYMYIHAHIKNVSNEKKTNNTINYE